MADAPALTQTADRVCVVIVTYGTRAALLAQVLAALANSTRAVDRVVVVENGSQNCPTGRLENGVPVHVVRLGTNTGSAGGYKAGLVRAAELDCDWVWLLDDDNVPEAEALERLLYARRCLGNDASHLFAAMRLDRQKYVNAAFRGTDVRLRKNAYLGVTAVDIPRWIHKRLRRNPAPNIPRQMETPIKRIDYAIYGGLLLHKKWLTLVGYPDERFYLYMDDTEYTHRITDCGGTIYLVGSSRVCDVDASWSTSNNYTRTPLLDPDADERRIYYTVRNHCYLQSQRGITSKLLFATNAMLYITILLIHGIVIHRSPVNTMKRLRRVLSASVEGIQGRLGRQIQEINE